MSPPPDFRLHSELPKLSNVTLGIVFAILGFLAASFLRPARADAVCGAYRASRDAQSIAMKRILGAAATSASRNCAPTVQSSIT